MVAKKEVLKLEVTEFRFQKHRNHRQRYRRAHLYFFCDTEEDSRKLWAEGRGHKHVNAALFDAVRVYLRMHPDMELTKGGPWDTGYDPEDKMYWDKDKFVFLKSKGFTLRITVKVLDE